MPYRYGHYFVAFVLLVTIAGFWPSYFLKVGADIPLAFHIHAFTATSWLLLLIAQSLAIHRRQNALHRSMGKASFVLFPMLMFGFVSIINLSASRYAAQESPFIMVLGPPFGIGMAVAMAAYVFLYYNALKHRRNVKLHAGYLLATPVILFESPFGRVISLYFPWMDFLPSEGPRGVLDVIIISDAMAFAFAFAVYLTDRKHGAPWLATMGFILLQMATMWFAEWTPGAPEAFAAYSRLPPGLTLILGVAIGIATAWLGWQHGLRKFEREPKAQPT